jgi:hypothetical protein
VTRPLTPTLSPLRGARGKESLSPRPQRGRGRRAEGSAGEGAPT